MRSMIWKGKIMQSLESAKQSEQNIKTPTLSFPFDLICNLGELESHSIHALELEDKKVVGYPRRSPSIFRNSSETAGWIVTLCPWSCSRQFCRCSSACQCSSLFSNCTIRSPLPWSIKCFNHFLAVISFILEKTLSPLLLAINNFKEKWVNVKAKWNLLY